MDAIIVGQATITASPSYDKRSAATKQRSWEKFVDSLDWDLMIEKTTKKTDIKKTTAFFSAIGIPNTVKKVKEVK